MNNKLLYFFFILFLFIVSDLNSNEEIKISIELKTTVVVLGPDITLGEISNIVISASVIWSKLVAIKVGNARPPGEVMEIKLSHIKRCLKVAGFEEYTKTIRGPRTIRVVTAQVEIDKAILKENFV